MFLFRPRKGAEAPDLNALKLCETRGFSGQFQTKSVFQVQNKYIYRRFEGNKGTLHTSTQSRVLRMRLNVSTRVQTEVTAFWLDQPFLYLNLKLKLKLM